MRLTKPLSRTPCHIKTEPKPVNTEKNTEKNEIGNFSEPKILIVTPHSLQEKAPTTSFKWWHLGVAFVIGLLAAKK